MAHGLRVSPPCSMIVNWCIASHAVAVDHGAVEDGLVFRASAYGDQQGVTTTGRPACGRNTIMDVTVTA